MVDLHDDAVVVDAHNDLLLTLAYRRARGDRDHFGEYWLPQMRAGGVDVQIAPVFIEDDFLPEGGLRRILQLIELLHAVAADHPDDVAVCTSASGIDAALAAGRIAFVPALEGCEPLGTDVELLRSMYRLGIRVASLTHFGRTPLADGSALEDLGAGLTPAGAAALAEMERLGILVDVSHLSAAGTDEVLERATRPVVATHSSCRAIRDHHRNLRDDQLRGIAATGGVIGINFFPEFVDPADHSMGRLVDHIEHAVEVAGPEHVGLGPDFVREYFCMVGDLTGGMLSSGVRATDTIEGLESIADLPVLTAALLDRGLDEPTVRGVLGENFLRVLRRVLADTPAATAGVWSPPTT
ncbi:MAG TPA: dipeptidase [Egicoccus sp.]|nr:dipeptidase [Egicoccus sp.]HSK24583.1 dipeptidase [Egicoccus sp.]